MVFFNCLDRWEIDLKDDYYWDFVIYYIDEKYVKPIHPNWTIGLSKTSNARLLLYYNTNIFVIADNTIVYFSPIPFSLALLYLFYFVLLIKYLGLATAIIGEMRQQSIHYYYLLLLSSLLLLFYLLLSLLLLFC